MKQNSDKDNFNTKNDILVWSAKVKVFYPTAGILQKLKMDKKQWEFKVILN